MEKKNTKIQIRNVLQMRMRSNSFANYATNKSIKTNGAQYPSGASKIFYNNINKITKNPKLDTLQNEVGNIKILPSYSKE